MTSHDILNYALSFASLAPLTRRRAKCDSKNKDVIVYSFHDDSDTVDDDGGGSVQESGCSSYATPANYYTEVRTFVSAWIAQTKSVQQQQQGNYYKTNNNNHRSYTAESYLECTPQQVNGGGTMYVRLGCSSTSTQALAVNLYIDSSCTTLSSMGSVTGLDVTSDLEVRPWLVKQHTNPQIIVQAGLDKTKSSQVFVRIFISASLQGMHVL
jgi:hypothetical protein